MKNFKPVQLSLWEKLVICWGILWLKVDLGYNLRDKERYIFNKGYNTGLKDTKLPGEYKVTISTSGGKENGGQSDDYKFDDLQTATNFIEGCKNPEACYVNSFEFVQTYLDRDLDHLIPK